MGWDWVLKMPFETVDAPWCYKWDRMGLKSSVFRAPTVMIRTSSLVVGLLQQDLAIAAKRKKKIGQQNSLLFLLLSTTSTSAYNHTFSD